jgi:hypothetical protein
VTAVRGKAARAAARGVYFKSAGGLAGRAISTAPAAIMNSE